MDDRAKDYGVFALYFGIESLAYIEDMDDSFVRGMIEAARAETIHQGINTSLYVKSIVAAAQEKNAPKNAGEREKQRILRQIWNEKG